MSSQKLALGIGIVMMGGNDEVSLAVEFPDTWDFILRFAEDTIKISQKYFRTVPEKCLRKQALHSFEGTEESESNTSGFSD
ncbi:hypothetical protein [Vacuolonema iberomarrocanum]|uniref:hypothetical protein n=1 Tax=Vacuolonema iberomarrocanum TaxID=3454632 RepID=UPI001A0D1CC9|nr:hypothetical protein [filamentous cyanobacterium LEGE 07170]